jgi:hypothetical protein
MVQVPNTAPAPDLVERDFTALPPARLHARRAPNASRLAASGMRHHERLADGR